MTDQEVYNFFHQTIDEFNTKKHFTTMSSTSTSYSHESDSEQEDMIQFRKVVNERIEKIKQLLLIKGKEYSRNNNPFHNFDKGSAFTGSEPEDVLWGFCMKHIISLDDIIGDLYDDTKEIAIAQVEEKIGDIIVYLILLEGLFKRRVL